MREAIRALADDRLGAPLQLKIGIHEGPCLAVMLNERQDYFGQTVNIAARVQDLATEQAIFATGPVVGHARTAALLAGRGAAPVPHAAGLRGIAAALPVYEIP